MSLSKDLMRAIDCPVCLEPPRKVPVPLCPNGHFVCSDCTAKIQACPMCQNPRMDSRSLFADSVTQAIPLPCRFIDLGCSSPDMPMAEREHHEQNTCDHREVECPDLRCQNRLSLSKIQDHLKDEYKKDFTIGKGKKLILKEHSVGQRHTWNTYNIHIRKDNFIINSFDEGSKRHWWVYYIGTKEEAEKFKVQLDLKNNNGNKTLSFVSSPISIDVPKNDVIGGGLGLVLLQTMIEQFVDGDSLSYSTTIQLMDVPGSSLSAPVQALNPIGQDRNLFVQGPNPIGQDMNLPMNSCILM